MSNFYPALRARMGKWDYYIAKMNMREVADMVHFATDVHREATLSDAIQRELKGSRVKDELVRFLTKRDDRFFSSIVVAAIGGAPKFFGIEIADDQRFELLSDDRRLNETFGVLRFDGSQNYFALDGQHRLAAIKALLDPNNEAYSESPANFGSEELSVLIVVPADARTQEGDELSPEFRESYRRLFSSLNRYARPTDRDTNIIMDEDDALAIVTRRLITEHEFFYWSGAERKSARVKVGAKNLTVRDPQFTSLQTLYAMNRTFLSSKWRQSQGWDESGQKLDSFTRFRPDEEILDALYDELRSYWDALLEALPDLRNDPLLMRSHSEDGEEDATDSLLFWPIGQEFVLAPLVRYALDWRLPDPRRPSTDDLRAALQGLDRLEWNLHSAPWRYFALTWDEFRSRWMMRNEDRTATLRIGLRIQRWVFGLDELSEPDIEGLRIEWRSRLIPLQNPEDAGAVWNTVLQRRQELAALL